MQPYFMPYAGYFRLLAAADLFVAFDCVQFPRRGWVHRNRLRNPGGELAWLTLPIQKSDRDTTRITDLCFREHAQGDWDAECRRFPCLTGLAKRDHELASVAFDLRGTPVEYLIRTLEFVSRRLGIQTKIVRSSNLGVDSTLRAQERIIEILKKVGGDFYLNAPGGRELYSTEAFRAAGITLRFFSEYNGSFGSILERVVLERPSEVLQEINENLTLHP